MLSKTPKYPKSNTVYIDFITFSLDCFNVLLKDPRLILAFVSLKLAFSSYFKYLPDIFSAKMSISSVSSCIFVS